MENRRYRLRRKRGNRGRKDAPARIRTVVYRLLAFRDRSRREVEEKLEAKGFSPEEIGEVVAEFARSGLIDDGRFARAWVQSRLRHRPRSAALIRLELLRKGVDPGLARKVLREEVSPELERTMARRLARRRVDAYRGDDREAARRKLIAYLARRGFSYSIISAALAEVFKEDELPDDQEDVS